MRRHVVTCEIVGRHGTAYPPPVIHPSADLGLAHEIATLDPFATSGDLTPIRLTLRALRAR